MRGNAEMRDTVWFDDALVATTYIGPTPGTDGAAIAPK